jgi:hypothetical protein
MAISPVLYVVRKPNGMIGTMLLAKYPEEVLADVGEVSEILGYAQIDTESFGEEAERLVAEGHEKLLKHICMLGWRIRDDFEEDVRAGRKKR